MALPRATVLMPLYNGARYVGEAIESILKQTFCDFEFLIIDDGSLDNSADIVRSYNDERIKLICNQNNSGVIDTLNLGITLSQGDYIARMDADDISRPTRLAKQIDYLDSNPKVGLCGSWVRFIPRKYDFVWKLPMSSEEIRCLQFSSVGVAHPSIMFRRKLFLDNDLFYDSKYMYIEDYELWGRALKLMEFANIQEVLLDYRISSDQICSKHHKEQLMAVRSLRLENIMELGVLPTQDEQFLHESIINCSLMHQEFLLDQAEDWLFRLNAANVKVGIYDLGLFSKRLLDIWFSMCFNLSNSGVCSFARCFNSKLWTASSLPELYCLKSVLAWMSAKMKRFSNQ